MFVCNTNRLPWWALLSTWQPPRGENHLSCQLVWKDPLSHPKTPDWCVIDPLRSDIRSIGSQFLILPIPLIPTAASLQVCWTLHPRSVGHGWGQLVDLPGSVLWGDRSGNTSGLLYSGGSDCFKTARVHQRETELCVFTACKSHAQRKSSYSEITFQYFRCWKYIFLKTVLADNTIMKLKATVHFHNCFLTHLSTL